MKIYKIMIIFALCAFLLPKSNAQTFTIDKTVISYENKLRPCFSTEIDPAPKALQNAWEKYLKKGYRIKMKKSGSDKDVEKGADVMIASISAKRMDLYSRVSETATGSQFKVFAAYGYDIYLGDEGYERELDALERLFRKFLLQYLNQYYTAEIKQTTKDLKALQKEKISTLKSIRKNEGKITKTDQNIATLESTQMTAKGMDVKTLEKQHKASANKLKFENQNQEYSIEVQSLTEKATTTEQKLAQLRLKFSQLNQ